MKKIGYVLSAAAALTLGHAAAAVDSAAVDWGIGYAGNVGLGTREVRDVAVSVIQTLLGILGILALIIVLIGGFKWMTAGGNEEKTEEAKKLLGAGVIGLVIILSSWAIATYVINTLTTNVIK